MGTRVRPASPPSLPLSRHRADGHAVHPCSASEHFGHHPILAADAIRYASSCCIRRYDDGNLFHKVLRTLLQSTSPSFEALIQSSISSTAARAARPLAPPPPQSSNLGRRRSGLLRDHLAGELWRPRRRRQRRRWRPGRLQRVKEDIKRDQRNERTYYYDGGEKSWDEYSCPGRSTNHYITRKYLAQCGRPLLRSPPPGSPGPRWPRGVRL